MTPPIDVPPVPLLELRDVSAGYGPFRAIFDVSLEIAEGSVLALLGSNGEQHNRDLGGSWSAPNVAKHLPAVHVGHHDVQHDQVRNLGLQDVERLPPIGCGLG